MHFDIVLRCLAVYFRQRLSELCTLHGLSGHLLNAEITALV